jgi:hypothetical protein
MTLTVHAYSHESGKRVWIDLGPGKELFGFEVCRSELWGHEIMPSLHLTILPTLKEIWGFLIEDTQELEMLEQEAYIIRDNLLQIAQQTGYSEQFIMFRTQNLLDAIAIAREVSGGVEVG